MPEPGVCPKCGGPIPAARRADSRYCSGTCKRAAEFELRRIQRQLEHLEGSAATARMYLFPAQQLGRIQAEIDRAEARLRELLEA